MGEATCADGFSQWHDATSTGYRLRLNFSSPQIYSIEALRRRKTDPLGVVFVESAHCPTDPDMTAENIEAIKTFSGIQVSGVIPGLSDFYAPPAQAYQPFENLLFQQ
jgi:hypothetical protein